MDKGTSVKKIIMGEEVYSKLGYIGVKCRSQQDIDNNITVEESIKIEKIFFTNDEIYGKMNPDYFGVNSLTKKLKEIYSKHLSNCLPQILKEITNKINETEKNLKELGGNSFFNNCNNEEDKLNILYSLIFKFSDCFKKAIYGKYVKNSNGELNNGLCIRKCFNELYKEYDLDHKASTVYNDQEIQLAIQVYQGDNLSGFLSIDSFYSLVLPLLENFLPGAIDCLNSVFFQLEDLALKLSKSIFQKFILIFINFFILKIQVFHPWKKKFLIYLVRF